MGLFNLFKKKPKFIDEFFGELSYSTFNDSSKNFYDGIVSFENVLIGVTIEADELGPTDQQKSFFKSIEDNYSDIKNGIILPYLRIELDENVKESGLDDFEYEFKLDGISIGILKNKKRVWSLIYDANLMRHYVTIEFEDLEPIHMNIDG